MHQAARTSAALARRQVHPATVFAGGDNRRWSCARRRADFLKVLAGGNVETILRARIARRHQAGISMSRLIAETGWTKSFIEAQLAQAINENQVVRIGELLLHLPALEALKLYITQT